MYMMEQKKLLLLVCVFLVTLLVVKPAVENSLSSFIVATPELSESLRNVHMSQQLEEFSPWALEIGSRFESRKATLDAACLAEPKDPSTGWSGNTAKALKGLLYSQGLLVCTQAKVGCTTMKQILLGLIGYDKAGKKGKVIVHNGKNMRKILARNFFDGKELQYFMSKSFDPMSKPKPLPIRMMMARHPFDRLVSCYMEKFQGGDNTSVHTYFHTSLLKSNHIPYKKGEIRSFSFEEFLLLITEKHNQHWEPYWAKCYPCNVRYDYILHLDTFVDDLKYIFLKAGIDTANDDQFHTQRNNSTQKVNVERKHFLEYFKNIPENLLKKVHNIYRRDFKLFGYEFPDFMLKFENDYIP